MTVHIACADVGLECDFTAEAEDEEVLMEKVAAHAKATHDLDEIPEELAEQVQANIKTV